MEKDAFTKKIGKRISKIRDEKGLTQVDLAKKCGKKKQSISRLELGDINATAFYLYEVATALKVPMKELVDI
jgi:transcriptional regulator with XRE-family HTH domain